MTRIGTTSIGMDNSFPKGVPYELKKTAFRIVKNVLWAETCLTQLNQEVSQDYNLEELQRSKVMIAKAIQRLKIVEMQIAKIV